MASCFFDSAPVIYAVERIPIVGQRALARIQQLVSARESLVVSDLVAMECLVGPMKSQDSVLEQAFRSFFQSAIVTVVPISRQVCEQAARIRADFGFKSVDALHLAAAVESGCTEFVTNDLRLRRYSALKIEIV